MNFLWFVIIAVCAYFLGNVSFARIFARFKKQDITKLGSGNPGTTNVIRNYGFLPGVLTLLGDALKGAIPAIVGFYVYGGPAGGVEALLALYGAGFAAILGHIYPVFYKFKGGKGMATTLGVFAVADPLIMLIVLAILFVIVLFSDYISIGSLLLVTIFTLIEVSKIPDTADPALSMVVRLIIFGIFAITWFAFRSNIFRLLVGKENKANLKRAISKLKKAEIKKEKQTKKLEIETLKARLMEDKKARKLDAKIKSGKKISKSSKKISKTSKTTKKKEAPLGQMPSNV